MAESTKLEDPKTGKKDSHVRYFNMKVLKSHKKEEINELVSNTLDHKSILFSGSSTSYVDIANHVEMHVSTKSTKESTKDTLKWVHVAISNAKRTLLGIYHKSKENICKIILMNSAINLTEDISVTVCSTDWKLQ